MNKKETKEIKKLVDAAVALHRELAAKTEELKTLKAELVQQAHLHPEAVVATENGGSRWIAPGSDGCIARVSFPAAALVSEIEAESELKKQIQAIVGDDFRRFFTAVKVYQLVDNFRACVGALLPASKAAALIKICENQGAPRVSFEAAKPVDGNALS